MDHAFCKCEPPFFGLACSRRTVYPANHSAPSPVNFKIYMFVEDCMAAVRLCRGTPPTVLLCRYEFDARLIYAAAPWVWAEVADDVHSIYSAYYHFMGQFLNSTVRTEDPSEASLFYVPLLRHHYAGRLSDRG